MKRQTMTCYAFKPSYATIRRKSLRSMHPLLRRDNCASTVRRIRRNRSVGDPDVDERLHRLHVFLLEKTEQHGDGDVVHESRVEVTVGTDVPEWFLPVRVVQVRVQSEHLAEDRLEVSEEGFRETGRLSHPVMPCQRGEWCGQSGRAHGNGGIGTGSIEAARSVSGRRSRRGFGREGFRILDLAHNPTLHKGYVLIRRYFDGGFFVVEPSVGVAAVTDQRDTQVDRWVAHRPAVMVGHVFWLQMALPVLLSTS